MGVVSFESSLSKISIDNFLRIDAKFHRAFYEEEWNVFHSPSPTLVALKDILLPYSESFIYDPGVEYKGIPTGGGVIDEFGDIVSYQPVDSEEHPGRLCCKADQDCILISSLSGAKTPALLFDFSLDEYVFSNGFYFFKLKTDQWDKRFILYLLRTQTIKSILSESLFRGIGITAYKVEDFLKLKIPYLSLKEQQDIVKKIEPIASQIAVLKKKIVSQREAISSVFHDEFGFVWDKADLKKADPIHMTSFSEFSNDEFKFNISLKSRFIFREFIRPTPGVKWIALDKVVEVKGGKRLPKGQSVIEDETPFRYVRVDDLDWDGHFDINNVKYITEENHKVIEQYIAKTGDILLTIVGATVGKCGLCPEELDGENITENFARLIIRDRERFIPEYVNYCLMSKTSQFQFDEYTGKGSQGKLAVFRIKKVQIPDIDKNRQQAIIDRISQKVLEQENIREQIRQKQESISDIIEQLFTH